MAMTFVRYTHRPVMSRSYAFVVVTRIQMFTRQNTRSATLVVCLYRHRAYHIASTITELGLRYSIVMV